MRRRSDPDHLATELVALWSAATTEDFRRVLVMHPPAHRGANAFEPFLLLQKHHDLDPTGSAQTPMLLLTDARWRDGAGALARRIEGSGMLDDDQLDRLAEDFLAGDTIEEIIVIGLEDEEEEHGDLRPALVRREVSAPLRRWAAGRLAGRDPRRWGEVLGRADASGPGMPPHLSPGCSTSSRSSNRGPGSRSSSTPAGGRSTPCASTPSASWPRHRPPRRPPPPSRTRPGRRRCSETRRGGAPPLMPRPIRRRTTWGDEDRPVGRTPVSPGPPPSPNRRGS